MEESPVPLRRSVTLPPGLNEKLHAVALRDLTPAADEFVARKLGVGETLANYGECPVCLKFAVETYEQFLFRGPYGKRIGGGTPDPQYVRIEIRQECGHCNVQLWKMHPDVFAKL